MFRMAWITWEWNSITNVTDTSQQHNKTLKTQTETRMCDRTVPAQVTVPGVVFGFQSGVLDTLIKLIQSFLTLGASNNFTNTRHQDIHSGDGFPVFVHPHIE